VALQMRTPGILPAGRRVGALTAHEGGGRRFKYMRKGLCTNVFEFVIPELELQRADFRRLRSVWDFTSSDAPRSFTILKRTREI